MRRLLRQIRDRYHPLHQLRKIGLFRALAARFDFPVWVRVYGVNWPVRLRLLRSASYWLNRRTPEPEMMALFIALDRLFQPRVFWDVGANVGYYGWLLKSRDSARNVLLFEPDPDNVRLLRDTLRRARVDGVQLMPCAVTDANGRTSFAVDPVTSATGAVVRDAEQKSFARRHFGLDQRVIAVDATTLDAVREQHARVDLLKIDVEGHEQAVFRGASALLRQDQPVVIFECFGGGEPIFDELRALGYLLFDAERLGDGLDAAINYLALPARFASSAQGLIASWRQELEALRV